MVLNCWDLKQEFDFTNGVGRNINQTENTTELAAYVRYKGVLVNYSSSQFQDAVASLSNISPEPRLAF